MHQKRVTCELHDSYFYSMTIKHAIRKTAEVTYPDSRLWEDIEWAIELLYNSVKTGSQFIFGDQTRWWQDAVERTAVRESLCLFWRKTHTKGLHARSPTRPEGRRKEGPRDPVAWKSCQEKETVSRKKQQGPVGRRKQPEDESRAEKREE